MNMIKELYRKVVKFFKFAYTKRRKIEKFLGQMVVYALLITISYVFLFPLIKMITLSFMSRADIIDPEIDYIPKNPTFSNFSSAMVVLDGWKSLWASIWVSSVLAVAQTVVSALTGFAFARYDFRFKRTLFVLILVSFIIPVPVMLIPRMMMVSGTQDWVIQTFGWETFKLFGTITPQFVLSILGQGVNSAILILIFYNFFRMIPTVLYEAARIDGASAFAQFWHITIKISVSTIIVVFLFSFVWNWNETYVTGLFNAEFKSLPSQLGVFDNNFRSAAPDSAGGGGSNNINEAYKMAATLLSMIPLFIIYFAAQKQFVEGIEKTGITGE
jgi:multiple sugar transport system permease protein